MFLCQGGSMVKNCWNYSVFKIVKKLDVKGQTSQTNVKLSLKLVCFFAIIQKDCIVLLRAVLPFCLI